MRVCADTNILLRAVVRDNPVQAEAAARLLAEAELIAVSTPCLCEFAWVLNRGYKYSRAEVAEALRALIDTSNVVVDHQAVEAGLAVLDAGGDFADGVIAHAGRWLGADVFASFDKRAVSQLKAQGYATLIP